MMSETMREQLLAFLSETYSVDRGEIPLDESLVDHGIIDSIGLIEIAGFLEKTFGVRVQEEQMTRENFGSVNRMVDFVERQRTAGG